MGDLSGWRRYTDEMRDRGKDQSRPNAARCASEKLSMRAIGGIIASAESSALGHHSLLRGRNHALHYSRLK